MRNVNSEMTALAKEIRELSGTTTKKSIDAMTSDVNNANVEISVQTELLEQITIALEGKAIGGSGEEIKLQNKTVDPTTSQQTVKADSGYDGLNKVTVNAIPDEYITTTDATATADKIFLNETAYVDGEKVTGSFTIDSELTEQDDLINQLYTLVQTKSDPSSVASVQTADVTVNALNGTTVYYIGENGLETIENVATTVQMVVPSICYCKSSSSMVPDRSAYGECSIINNQIGYMVININGESSIRCNSFSEPGGSD